MGLHFEQGQLSTSLTAAATEVLETMFFASAESETLGSPLAGEARIAASLDFHGASAGSLSLSLEAGAAAELADNFFGNSDNHRAEAEAVMAELTNMICGAMLSRLDRSSVFCLDAPAILPAGAEVDGDVLTHLRLETGLLRLAFCLAPSETPERV